MSKKQREDERKDANRGVDRYMVIQVLRGKDRDGNGLVGCCRLVGAWSGSRSVRRRTISLTDMMLIATCSLMSTGRQCENDRLNRHGVDTY